MSQKDNQGNRSGNLEHLAPFQKFLEVVAWTLVLGLLGFIAWKSLNP